MEDNQIVELYWARSEQAIVETRLKYDRYCRYIATRILGNDADAEETVSDTYLKAWNTIPPNRPDSLKFYLGMLTRQLSFDAYEARNTQKRGGNFHLVLEELAECVSADAGDLTDRLALRDTLNRFLKALPLRTRRIFLRRYYYASSVSEIARDFGMKESAITVLMLRTRQKLKKFLEKEGILL